MKLYLKSKRNLFDAVGEYYPDEKKFIIKKSSVVNKNIASSESFKASKTIATQRKDVINDGKTVKDLIFKSPSTAANFVTGSSTNGLVAWKDKNGIKLKELLKNE